MRPCETSGAGAGAQTTPTAAPQGLLRFITCGSVDDGKSTLIGRLLHDARQLPDDQLAALVADSRTMGTQRGRIDFALLVDGLAAEREQGITIDVAYRYFSSRHRRFIVADTPGHEQYTRNMFTGASSADAAVLLVDARKGMLTQTRRHSLLVSLIGIRSVVLAVNKMDLVDWSQATFEDIEHSFRDFAGQIGLHEITAIPMSALDGDNVLHRSPSPGWYRGATLMEWLDSVPTAPDGLQAAPLRLPVQWVNRPSADFRGYAGTLVSGSVRPGDRVRVQPGGQLSTVARIVTADGDLPLAVAGQAVTLTMTDEIDISRGDVIAAVADAPATADQFEATLVWMAEEPMLPGRSYLFKLGTVTVTASITEHKHRLNVNTLERLAAKTLAMNEIGVCNLSLDRPVAYDPYANIRDMGSFILIDRLSGHTLGAGMLHFALRRSQNIHLQHLEVDRAARSALKAQQPAVVWLTGLSGAGKSTIANRLEQRLVALGCHPYLLDGDNLRHGLNRDLGFSAADRVENIRRVAEVARLMVDAGLIVIAALISPFRAERAMARSLVPEGEFVEVHIDVPLAVAEARDVKGLYAKARRGELENFTGIGSPYEAPVAPDVRVDTSSCTADEAAEWVLQALRERGLLSR